MEETSGKANIKGVEQKDALAKVVSVNKIKNKQISKQSLVNPVTQMP